MLSRFKWHRAIRRVARTASHYRCEARTMSHGKCETITASHSRCETRTVSHGRCEARTDPPGQLWGKNCIHSKCGSENCLPRQVCTVSYDRCEARTTSHRRCGARAASIGHVRQELPHHCICLTITNPLHTLQQGFRMTDWQKEMRVTELCFFRIVIQLNIFIYIWKLADLYYTWQDYFFLHWNIMNITCKSVLST